MPGKTKRFFVYSCIILLKFLIIINFWIMLSLIVITIISKLIININHALILILLSYSNSHVFKFPQCCDLPTLDQETMVFCDSSLCLSLSMTHYPCTLSPMSRFQDSFCLPATEARKYLYHFMHFLILIWNFILGFLYFKNTVKTFILLHCNFNCKAFWLTVLHRFYCWICRLYRFWENLLDFLFFSNDIWLD